MRRGSFPALTAGLIVAAALAGCGSSSKPSYCTQVSNFEDSVKTLEHVEVSPSNLSTIKADVQKVAKSAEELESAVKTEFAPQISSVKSSVAALQASMKEVGNAPSSSTLAHAAAVVPAQIEALKRSASEVKSVTNGFVVAFLGPAPGARLLTGERKR